MGPVVLAAAASSSILAPLDTELAADDTFAVMPWGVLLALVRLGPAFLIRHGLIAVAFAGFGGAVVLAAWMRPRVYWTYPFFMLPCSVAVLWFQMVIMRLLGIDL